jgi:TPR repeat protein
MALNKFLRMKINQMVTFGSSTFIVGKASCELSGCREGMLEISQGQRPWLTQQDESVPQGTEETPETNLFPASFQDARLDWTIFPARCAGLISDVAPRRPSSCPLYTLKNRVFAKAGKFATLMLVFLVLALRVQAQDTSFDFQAAQAAADKGEAKAQYELGHYYYATQIGMNRDYAKAAKYVRQSADQGYADAQVELGSYYGRGIGVPRNVTMAVQWYRKAADEGNALAQYAMGKFYAAGRGVTNDMHEAVQWWLKAAGQDQVEAEARLGELYLIPTAQYGTNYLNYAEALKWLHKAAAQGSTGAMNNLGVAYEHGLGLMPDFKEAARWYRAAAELGDDLGQANLGQLYFDGRGVEFDLAQAYKWFKLSAGKGNTLGVAGVANFQTHPLLTPKQQADAEQMVLDFHPQPAKIQR